jgi:hypothetical protein
VSLLKRHKCAGDDLAQGRDGVLAVVVDHALVGIDGLIRTHQLAVYDPEVVASACGDLADASPLIGAVGEHLMDDPSGLFGRLVVAAFEVLDKGDQCLPERPATPPCPGGGIHL